mmetsp:Transcript_26363/g.54382  ORF Transcript_26363/g.54382 Transcript_26363/m.54382 type:complete len:827 (+) Transcript_26363:169-2649(+)
MAINNIMSHWSRSNSENPTAQVTAKEALLSLVQGTEGKAWSASQSGWSSGSPLSVCQWEGITCKIGFNDSLSKVTSIRLPNAGLSGTIPTELGQLTYLEEFNLKGNLIRGSIPSELANLKQLNHLDLSDCLLTGTLPNRFESSTLSMLLLNENGLSGHFFNDETSPHLTSIQEIRLENNLLTGTIHSPTILQMGNLNTLSLSQNEISGVIPGYALGSLSNLEYLYLDSNNLVGPLPANLAQAGKSKIKELWVQSNALSGTVPATYERFDKLTDFFIDDNRLTGALTPNLCGPEINADFFNLIPDDAEEKNYCDHIACPAGSVGAEGVYPCSSCVGGDAAKLQNPYLGLRGACLHLTQRDALITLYEATSGNRSWTGDGDWDEFAAAFSGEGWTGGNDSVDESKMICALSGVSCDGHRNVIGISLRNRNLEGSIPWEIGLGLPFLEVLDLSDNYLTGYLPSDLRWTALTKLDISGNQIRGVVPPLLCMIGELNANGDEDVFYCNRVACPAGSYNAIGRHGANGLECIPCYDGNPFIGQKTCTVTKNPNDKSTWDKGVETLEKSVESISITWQFALIFVMMVWSVSVATCCYIRYSNLRHNQRKYQAMPNTAESDSDDSDEEYDEGEMPNYQDDEEQPRKKHKSYKDPAEYEYESEEDALSPPRDLIENSIEIKTSYSPGSQLATDAEYESDDDETEMRRASFSGVDVRHNRNQSPSLELSLQSSSKYRSKSLVAKTMINRTMGYSIEQVSKAFSTKAQPLKVEDDSFDNNPPAVKQSRSSDALEVLTGMNNVDFGDEYDRGVQSDEEAMRAKNRRLKEQLLDIPMLS